MYLLFVQNLSPFQMLIALLPALIFGALIVVPFWKIFERIGYSPWLSLLALIPGAVFVLLFIIAFAPWQTPGEQLGAD